MTWNFMNSVPVIYGVLLFIFFFASFIWSLSLLMHDQIIFIEWEIFSSTSSNFIMTFLFDWMSVSFMSVVLLISSMVMFYSYSYMPEDELISRFIILVFLFVFSMVLLILSPNMVSILLGWDGLGLVSYCLVIYYQNMKSASAGMFTILSNRVGDVAILLCISWMFNFGGWNFYYLPFLYHNLDTSVVMWLVLIAAMTKSAQIPFSAWLPAAMAAPTPVSALVHSSTLVTAGVYLLIRFSELLGTSIILLYISVLTMLMSGVGANFEMDLKKIIALSTLSQLGVMMMTLSIGLVELSYFHLISHALFKSLLFLCAGVYIHNYGDIQDIRYLGGVGKILPTTSLFFVGCSLSLCGFPFLSGFYSKDMILESFFMMEMNCFMFLLVFLATMATISYSVRLIYYMFMKNLGLSKLVMGEETLFMLIPMMALFLSSTMAGSGFSWLYMSPITIMLPLIFKLLILFFGLGVSIIFISLMNETLNFYESKFIKTKHFYGSMWLLPTITTAIFVNLLGLGTKFTKFMDQGWLEEAGGQGLYNKLTSGASMTDTWNLLGVKNYLMLFLIFITILALMI